MSTLTTTYGGGVRRADNSFRPVHGMATRIIEAFRQYRATKQNHAELRALTDRDLADIGLSRHELPVDLQREIEALQRSVGFTYAR